MICLMQYYIGPCTCVWMEKKRDVPSEKEIVRGRVLLDKVGLRYVYSLGDLEAEGSRQVAGR